MRKSVLARCAGVPTRSNIVNEVAQHQGGARKPRDAAQRSRIGLKREIAETLFPVGQLEPVERVHLDVEGEQVVAAVGALLGEVLPEEVLGRHAFADEPAEHVGEHHENGVYLTAPDPRSQRVLVGQHAARLPAGAARAMNAVFPGDRRNVF